MLRSLTWDSEDRVVRVANHETGASKAFRFDAEDNKVEATGDGFWRGARSWRGRRG